MPLRIKSRVRHLADAADHNVIQRALCIEVGPPATLNWPSVSRQKRFARIDIADRADGTIGAYLFAHPTANTGMGNIPDLLDDRQGPVFMDRLGLAALPAGSVFRKAGAPSGVLVIRPVSAAWLPAPRYCAQQVLADRLRLMRRRQSGIGARNWRATR